MGTRKEDTFFGSAIGGINRVESRPALMTNASVSKIGRLYREWAKTLDNSEGY